MEAFQNDVIILFRLLGNGLITEPDSEAWKKKRRAYDCAFHKTLVVLDFDGKQQS